MTLAIQLLQKYINHRQKSIKKWEKVKQEPEMNCDLILADERIAMCNAEIKELQEAITKLHSTP